MKSNVIKLYKHFCEMIENPRGNDSQERTLVRNQAIKNKLNLEEHFRSSKKYQGDEEILSLLNPKPKEVKKDGKKSKR